MRFLSLFDGISCGRLAAERAGIPVTQYISSEIDKHAIKIAQKNFPKTIQIGDVACVRVRGLGIEWYDGVNWNSAGPVPDIVLFGSPCQGFSIAGDMGGFDDPRSRLFFEAVRIVNEIRKIVPDVLFLMENVMLKPEWRDIVSRHLGVEPIEINSALVSGQNRRRLYWTNILGVTQPEDKGIRLVDILEAEPAEKYYHTAAAINYMNRSVKGGRNHWDFAHHSDTNKDKSSCITANFKKGVPYNVLIDRRPNKNGIILAGRDPLVGGFDQNKRVYSTSGKAPTLIASSGGYRQVRVALDNEVYRRLTPVECERLQTLPDNYTDGVSDTHRYSSIGNAWTVDVIAHILSFSKNKK